MVDHLCTNGWNIKVQFVPIFLRFFFFTEHKIWTTCWWGHWQTLRLWLIIVWCFLINTYFILIQSIHPSTHHSDTSKTDFCEKYIFDIRIAASCTIRFTQSLSHNALCVFLFFFSSSLFSSVEALRLNTRIFRYVLNKTEKQMEKIHTTKHTTKY